MGHGPARLVCATTLRVRPTPERPLSPCVITVLHSIEAIAVAAWRRWIINEPPPTARAVDPFGPDAKIMRDRHGCLAGSHDPVDVRVLEAGNGCSKWSGVSLPITRCRTSAIALAAASARNCSD
jgi:hypothetical protein